MIFHDKVAIVIPTFNRKEVTQKCLARLIGSTYTNIKIIICDSDSTDGTREECAKFEKTTVVNVGGDAWWSAAVNRGVEIALKEKYDYILVINDDIDFTSYLIEELREKAFQHPGKIISPSQKTTQGVFLGIVYLGLDKEHKKIWVNQESREIDVESTNGCCLFIPAETFLKIGMFNEKDCPHLYGDTEFQIRAWNRGIMTLALPNVSIAQQEATNYYRRLNFSTLLTFKGSPVHLRAYLTCGKALFKGSMLAFIFMGFSHHRIYILALIKSIYFSIKAKLKR